MRLQFLTELATHGHSAAVRLLEIPLAHHSRYSDLPTKGVWLDIESAALELRNVVFKAVSETLGDSILLSGGLDTTIIAAVARSLLERKKFQAYTIILKDSPAPDLDYSKLVSSRFNIPHSIRVVTLEDLERALPEVIRVLGSFDPMEIRNSVTVYLGLKEAKKEGFRKVMTGDASDELFAGYSFIFTLQREVARSTLRHLWEVMHFSSIPLAKSLGIEARLPFLETQVKDFAMKHDDFELLVGSKETPARHRGLWEVSSPPSLRGYATERSYMAHQDSDRIRIWYDESAPDLL